MERIKQIAIIHDDELMKMPIIANIGREVWKTKEAKEDESQGIIWEAITALTLILAGANIIVMRHPESLKLVKELIVGPLPEVKEIPEIKVEDEIQRVIEKVEIKDIPELVKRLTEKIIQELETVKAQRQQIVIEKPELPPEKKIKTRKEEIYEFINAEDKWESIGPTPMPSLATLRRWDMRLLKTYKPFYAPFCDLCCLCTYGKCDLTQDNRGACGIDICGQQGRIVLIASLMGCAAHAAHARHLVDYLIEKLGEDYSLDLGGGVAVEAPHIRTVLGLKPKTLGDLRKAIEYVECGIASGVSATHTGQEGSNLDFESKALHIGMLDHVGMEVADIAQIVGFKFPTSVAETPLIDIGWGSIDREKPVVCCIGHNAAVSTVLIDYLREIGMYDKVEVTGICCTALDNSRYSDKAKIVGPLSRQRFFLNTGIADLIITDEQCIWCDTPEIAKRVKSALIATSDKACYGLEDVTHKEIDEIVKMIVDEEKQVLILDVEKAGKVAAKALPLVAEKRKKKILSQEEVIELAKKCKKCMLCERLCPNMLPISDALQQAANGNFEELKRLFAKCLGCGKCQQQCPQGVEIFKIMQQAASWDSYKIRAGRGPIMDTEIRRVGQPIVFGTIPGIIAIVGCSNFPEEIDEIAEIAEEFAKRNYIVVLSGCSAMAAAFKKDEDGKTLYEKYKPDFDAGGIVNVGSCVSNSHITGAAMKVANIFAKLPLRGNYEVIADYILNRVGAVGLAWGAYSQKAVSIATGCNRLGIPVVVGPHSSKYRRLYLSRKEEDDWSVIDGRTKEFVDTKEPSPEHLIIVVESKERAIITLAKLCIRKNDTHQGRQIKLAHYISLYRKYMGTLPDDLANFVRTDKDVPVVYKKEVMEYLKEVGWQPKPVLTLPTWIGTYESDIPIDAVITG
jgi:acetyl-CoA decarbonylase/synthase complex subunit alpha